MSTITAEGILELLDQLSPAEQLKFQQLLEQRKTAPPNPEAANGRLQPPPASERNGAPTSRLTPIPMPDGKLERQWLKEHRREYADQWVALDGDRLIAASANHNEVWAAAKADGAYLPLITFIENPERITISSGHELPTNLH